MEQKECIAVIFEEGHGSRLGVLARSVANRRT